MVGVDFECPYIAFNYPLLSFFKWPSASSHLTRIISTWPDKVRNSSHAISFMISLISGDVLIVSETWRIFSILGKILKGCPVWVYGILYLVRLFRNNIFRIAWFSRLLASVRWFPFFHSFNLADWLTLGYVFAVKPISKKRLPEITFVQLKKQSIPTAQSTPQIHRMKVMLNPDSHEFRVPLMRMKQLSVCALRLDCDNL